MWIFVFFFYSSYYNVCVSSAIITNKTKHLASHNSSYILELQPTSHQYQTLNTDAFGLV